MSGGAEECAAEGAGEGGRVGGEAEGFGVGGRGGAEVRGLGVRFEVGEEGGEDADCLGGVGGSRLVIDIMDGREEEERTVCAGGTLEWPPGAVTVMRVSR